MSVASHAAALRAANGTLTSAQRRAASGWEDKVRRSFEQRILQPIDREASLAQAAADQLAADIARALSQLG